jgi:acetate kinase
VHFGQSVDTTMGFTPTGGLPMGRRSGDLDPGVAAFLCAREGLDPAGLFDLLTHRSGLLGVSETSSDVRDLLALETQDPRAAEALALFVYRVKQAIGGMAAALGGMETLVFSGGIGTHSHEIRGRICAGLGFLGIELGRERNEVHADVVSTDHSRVTVRVIRTDEEVQIARTVLRHLAP